ncbi:MAG TPA: FtsX-like permease family protein, partial [Flavisolibacter sp.]|nr:FtsX-like permease family protein [Flavisolibacter sp.]
ANPGTLEKKLPAFLNKYGQQQFKDQGVEKQLKLQPVASIHTTTDYEHEMIKPVSPAFLFILLLIALMIQFIACINFMNLSTARASKRAKEVGVRKVIGAERKDLIRQFLGESFILALIGVVIAIGLLVWMLPFLNSITNADVKLSLLKDYQLWVVLAAIIIITGLVAGSYPAFYLSAFQAIKVIKGNFTNHISASGIRRSLVVFQFVLSIILISGIIVIYSQLNYIKNKDLGFDKEQKLTFSFYTNDSKSKMESFANDLRQLSEVRSVSRANNYPGQMVFNDMPFYLPGGNIATGQEGRFMRTDEYFVKAAGLRLESGRDFRAGDSGKVIINELLARRLGIDPATAEGKTLYSVESPETHQPLTFQIAGVIRDFNYNSLRDQVNPFLLIYDTDAGDFSEIIVNTSSGDYKSLLAKIEGIWHKDLPAVPFEYNFLDDQVQKLYETEITLSRIINSFTLMAILISCLGLFGLAAFSAEQRSKEIGIRKVLGSSISGIVNLLSRDFLKLVMIALLIAVPISWWCMSKWLQAYVYRINLSWWMYALAGFIAVVIALGTVSFQAIRAAMANPVKSLKAE